MTNLSVTLNLPARSVQTLNELAAQWGVPRDAVITRMIDDYARRRQQHLAIGQLTLKQLGIMPLNQSIDQLQLDADAVAQAMSETYGSDDAAAIIRKTREFEVNA